MEEYISHVIWEKDGKQQETTDTHQTKRMAQGVVDTILDLYKYHPCPYRGKAISGWVKPIE